MIPKTIHWCHFPPRHSGLCVTGTVSTYQTSRK